VRQEDLGAVDHAPVVDVHDALDLLELGDLDIAGESDAGVVVDLIDLAEVVFDLVGVEQEAFAFGDVEPVGLDPRADRRQAVLGDLEAFCVDVADGYGRPGSAQCDGQCLTDSLPGPGHDRNFAGKSLHESSC
jgi:hypothetical protein